MREGDDLLKMNWGEGVREVKEDHRRTPNRSRTDLTNF